MAELLGVDLPWVVIYLASSALFFLAVRRFFSRHVRAANSSLPAGGPSPAAAGGPAAAAPRAEARLDVGPLVTVLLVLPVATFGLTFPISIWMVEPAHLRLEPPFNFLSNSINHPPASCVGAFGFIVTLPALLLVISARWLQHANRVAELEASSGPNPPQMGWRCLRARLAVQNQRCLVAGLWTTLGAGAVAAFQWVNSLILHCFAAMFFFVGGVLYCNLDASLQRAVAAPIAAPNDREAKSEGPALVPPNGRAERASLERSRRARLVCARGQLVLGVLCFVCLAAIHVAGLAVADGSQSGCGELGTLGVTCGMSDLMITVAAAFEIAVFVALLAYFAGLLREVRGLSLAMHLVSREGVAATTSA